MVNENLKKPEVQNKKCWVQNTIKDIFLKLYYAGKLLTNNNGEEVNDFSFIFCEHYDTEHRYCVLSPLNQSRAD